MIKNEPLKPLKKLSIWRIFGYFIIYSIIGYFIETIFCIAKYGIWESRQSFMYGPFCAIYGLGAVIIIVSLRHFRKNYNTIFLAGCIVGSIIEYLVSLIGELILHVKWWDYSSVPLNLNGRICLLYSIFWGGLSLYLLVSLNPRIDDFIDWLGTKLNVKFLKFATIFTIILLILDALITIYAEFTFTIRMVHNFNLNVANKDDIEIIYNKMYSNEFQNNIINTFFSDEQVLKVFPRLKIEDINGNVIYFSDLLTDITPYYKIIWEPSKIINNHNFLF